MYMRVFICVYAWMEFICICECLYVFMHGSSLYVYASVYMCICMDQVYMYMRVFIVGVDRLSAPILSILPIIDIGHFQNILKQFADNFFFYYANKHTIYR